MLFGTTTAKGDDDRWRHLPTVFSNVHYVDVCLGLSRRLEGRDRGWAMVLVLLYFDVVRCFEEQHPDTPLRVYRAALLHPVSAADPASIHAQIVAEIPEPKLVLQVLQLLLNWTMAVAEVAESDQEFPHPQARVWRAVGQVLREVLQDPAELPVQ